MTESTEVSDGRVSPAIEEEPIRWQIALELGRCLAGLCFERIRYRLCGPMEREAYDGWLRSLERGLGNLWSDEASTSILHLINELQLYATDELHAEWLCDLETRAVENFQRFSDLQSAMNSVVEELASSLRYVSNSVRHFVHVRDSADQMLSRFFELGFAIADCQFPSSRIPSFVSMQIPKEKLDATLPRLEDVARLDHQGKLSCSAPWRGRRRTDHVSQPELSFLDHLPGTLPISDEAVAAVLQRLSHISPPLKNAETNRIAVSMENFRGRRPADDPAGFNLIHQRLSESIRPAPDVDEVEWRGMQVKLSAKKVRWGDREPFTIDETPPLRLLYLLVRHEGTIEQTELMEILWNGTSRVLNQDRALAKVRSKLDHILQKKSGLPSTTSHESAGGARVQNNKRRGPQKKPVHVVPENADRSERKKYGPNCSLKLRLELPTIENTSTPE